MTQGRKGASAIVWGAILCAGLAGRSVAQNAGDPLAAEMAPVLGQVKSADSAERTAAVHELLALREAVSLELRRIVEEAEEGKLRDGSKASALYMMGKLRLAQCADLLERERNWRWDWRTDPSFKEHWMVLNTRTSILPMWEMNMAEGLFQSARCPETVSLLPDRPKGSLGDYPALHDHLSNLRKNNWQERSAHEDTILKWYDIIYESMNRVLDPSWAGVADVYGNEVKATAAYVLGEYRIPHPFGRIKNVDLRDENGVCDPYAQTLSVETSEPDRPCLVALIKSGFGGTIHSCLDRIADTPDLSRVTRERLARVVVAIDPQEARKVFDEKVERYESGEMLLMAREERQRRVTRLRSVEAIVKGCGETEGAEDLQGKKPRSVRAHRPCSCEDFFPFWKQHPEPVGLCPPFQGSDGGGGAFLAVPRPCGSV